MNWDRVLSMAHTRRHEFAKRLPRAVAVGLLSTLVLGAALGAAYAAGEPELPETFGLPALHEGDRAEYASSGYHEWSGELWGEPMDENYTFSDDRTGFEWGAARLAPTHEGQQVLAEPLRITNWIEDEGKTRAIVDELLFEPGSLHPFAWRSTRNESSEQPPSGLLGWGNTTVTRDVVSLRFLEHAFSCGVRTLLQGREVETREPLPFTALCPGPTEPTEARFVATGTETIDGLATVRYSFSNATTTMDFWFAREVPFPVKIHVTIDAEQSGLHLRGEETAKLVGFKRGATPYPAGAPVDASRMVPVQLAPLTENGPVATGFQMAFPLDEALSALRQASAEVREYETQHPRAHLVFASHSISDSPEASYHMWTFILGDHETALVAAIVRSGTDALDGVPAALHDLLAPTRSTWTNAARMDGLAHLFPPASALPDRMPPVASVAQAWAHFDPQTDDPTQATTWGFELTCGNFNCTPGAGAVWVGRDGAPEPEFDIASAILGGQQEASDNYTSLAVDAVGEVIAFEETHARAVARNEGLLATSNQTPQSKPEPTDTPLAAVSPWWTWPTPEAAAGAGILGLLIGAVYWLWPSIKGAPLFGLFSRLRENQVLKHPARAQILQELEAEPGLHHSELRRRLQAGNGTVEHHLRILVANNLVIRRKEAGYACFFPARGVDRKDVAAMPWAKSEGARKVLAAVAQEPGRSGRQLAAASGLDPATVNYHLRRLRDAGLVEARRNGRSLAVHPTGQGLRIAAA